MYSDKFEDRSKWSEDDEAKLCGALETIKVRLKEVSKRGIRQVSFPMVGPVLGFVHAEKSTTNFQRDVIRHKVSSFFFHLGLVVTWKLQKYRELWPTDFPQERNHVHMGKSCDVWKATLSW